MRSEHAFHIVKQPIGNFICLKLEFSLDTLGLCGSN